VNEHAEARFAKPFHPHVMLGLGFLLVRIGGSVRVGANNSGAKTKCRGEEWKNIFHEM
jgi:hypothetical protein